jgi:hypothetical protein
VRNHLLQIVDGSLELERSKDPVGDLLVVDAHHPPAVRPEERLHDDVAHSLEGGHGRVEAFRDDGPRGREPGLLEERRGVELVHGSLDGAGRVQHGDTHSLQDVQGVEAEDDLFEGAARDDPDEDRVALLEWCAFRLEARPLPDPGDQRVDGQQVPSMAVLLDRPRELFGVPTPTGAQDGDVHQSLTRGGRVAGPRRSALRPRRCARS